MQPDDIIKVGNSLGECVLWDGAAQALWWTDIPERRLYRCDWRTRAIEAFETPRRLCSFGFVEDDRRLIAAFDVGFAIYDPYTQAAAWLGEPVEDRPDMRLNDGRVDRHGRFWAGSMAESRAGARTARLYRVDGTGAVSTQESGISISNSLCWSPDGSVLYFADSVRHVIWRYDHDAETGAISGRRAFARTPDDAYPDGGAVDAEGFLWSAQWGASRVVRYRPDGAVDRVIETPCRQPSCVAFGGVELDLLFVTTARAGLSDEALRAEPSAGDVLVYNVKCRGLPETRFLWRGGL